MDVVLVRWPAEADRRATLRVAGQPRLLLVDDGTMPPLPDDDLEDWIRMPASEADLELRLDGLRRRMASAAREVPQLDDDGVLRFGDGWVPLPPVEARLAAELLRRFGAVASRADLTKAGWPGGSPGRNALDVHVLRLRRRLQPVELAIRTVRARGYLLEPASAASSRTG